MPRVVDASILAAILFREPRREEALARVGDARLVAPIILTTEVANAGVKKVRAGRLTGSALQRAMRELTMLDVELVPTDVTAVAMLALAGRLSAYDASYLWVARRLGFPLETFDERLRKAYGETNSD